VRVPGVLGELGVLPGHTPLLTSLGIGPLAYSGPSGSGALAVAGGFAEVLAGRVTVLADVAEAASAIDVEGARSARTEAEAAMKTASADELDELDAAYRMAVTRLEVAGDRDH
jgi:F-type H+-transporting ATPase subunit epsilon